MVAEDDRIALFPPAHDGLPSSPGDVWQDSNRPPPPPDPQRRRKLAIGLSALGAAVLVVLGYLGLQLTSVFSDGGRPAIVVSGPDPAQPPAVRATRGRPPDERPAPPPRPAARRWPPGSRSTTAAATGTTTAGCRRVIDGNPDSGWNTFTYKQQFPALKPGVGIMVSFASAGAAVRADHRLAEPGHGGAGAVGAVGRGRVPGHHADGRGRPSGDGPTPVSLAGSQPVTHVLVWITKLGGGDGQNRTEINELQFQRAGG